MLTRLLAHTKYLILLPVVGALISAVVIFVYDIFTTVMVSWDVLTSDSFGDRGLKVVAVSFVKLLDLFLLGTVLYIVALGLYQLFIDPDIPLPRWVQVKSIDTLKEQLLNVVAVLLVVAFLAEAIEWDGGTDILAYGGAIALVVAAVAVLRFAQSDARLVRGAFDNPAESDGEQDV